MSPCHPGLRKTEHVRRAHVPGPVNLRVQVAVIVGDKDHDVRCRGSADAAKKKQHCCRSNPLKSHGNDSFQASAALLSRRTSLGCLAAKSVVSFGSATMSYSSAPLPSEFTSNFHLPSRTARLGLRLRPSRG